MSAPELILTNGKVYSVALDGKVTHAEAVAIKGGRILKIGASSEIEALADETTDVIDCKGNTILPGLCDVHCHPSIAAASMSAADLFGVYRQEGQSADEVIDILMGKLKEYVDANPDKEVIRGTGWVIANFNPAERMPTRHDIDKICADKPVILESFCQHNIWANTKAIEIAGVDENTPDTKIGCIHREENGYPQGVFTDPEAMEYIKMGVPGYDLSVDEYKDAILLYQHEFANKYGVTMIQDCMHSDNAREAYRQLAEEGRLTLYARAVYHLKPECYQEQMPEFIARKGSDNVGNDFRIDTVKMFAEGEFSIIGGYLPEYCDSVGEPRGSNGALYWPDDVFVDYAAKAMEAGFQVHVHAMGDLSVKQTVDCLAEAQHRAGKENPRSVVAHLMLVPDETAVKMGQENIIANCQPRWMVYDGDIYAMTPMMGKEKAETAYPYKKLLDAGVRVAFGTDFPVTPPPDTMHEIQCAMTRRVFPDAPDYEKYKVNALGTEPPATLNEAIRSLSVNGAYQIFAEEYTGSIEEGKSAELVILDRDIETTPADEIYSIKIAKTIFKGKVVYDKSLES